jgi:hypothetical protein
MIAEMLVLRLVHILGGIFWVGSTLFTSLFLLPALAQSGAGAGQVMAALQQRRVFIILPIVAVLTIASGLRLMWITSVGFSPAYFNSPVGRTFALSGAAAIVAFVIGILAGRPAAMRAAALGRTLATTTDASTRGSLESELTRVRRRAAVAGMVVLVLLLLGAGGMAIARYLS